MAVPRLLSDLALLAMREMRREADHLLAEHRKLLPRHGQISAGGAYIDSLSRGEALHVFLNSLGSMSPEDAVEAAKDTSKLFLSKHNEKWTRDYVVQRSLEQDRSYLNAYYKRIKLALGEPIAEEQLRQIEYHASSKSENENQMPTYWRPVECRDNNPERVYWQILRRNPETRQREYGLSENENGNVLEFENREQAQSACDVRNGVSDFVYDDENEIRIKRGEKRDKAVIRPRVGPEALSAILADTDDN